MSHILRKWEKTLKTGYLLFIKNHDRSLAKASGFLLCGILYLFLSVTNAFSNVVACRAQPTPINGNTPSGYERAVCNDSEDSYVYGLYPVCPALLEDGYEKDDPEYIAACSKKEFISTINIGFKDGDDVKYLTLSAGQCGMNPHKSDNFHWNNTSHRVCARTVVPPGMMAGQVFENQDECEKERDKLPENESLNCETYGAPDSTAWGKNAKPMLCAYGDKTDIMDTHRKINLYHKDQKNEDAVPVSTAAEQGASVGAAAGGLVALAIPGVGALAGLAVAAVAAGLGAAIGAIVASIQGANNHWAEDAPIGCVEIVMPPPPPVFCNHCWFNSNTEFPDFTIGGDFYNIKATLHCPKDAMDCTDKDVTLKYADIKTSSIPFSFQKEITPSIPGFSGGETYVLTLGGQPPFKGTKPTNVSQADQLCLYQTKDGKNKENNPPLLVGCKKRPPMPKPILKPSYNTVTFKTSFSNKFGITERDKKDKDGNVLLGPDGKPERETFEITSQVMRQENGTFQGINSPIEGAEPAYLYYRSMDDKANRFKICQYYNPDITKKDKAEDVRVQEFNYLTITIDGKNARDLSNPGCFDFKPKDATQVDVTVKTATDSHTEKSMSLSEENRTKSFGWIDLTLFQPCENADSTAPPGSNDCSGKSSAKQIACIEGYQSDIEAVFKTKALQERVEGKPNRKCNANNESDPASINNPKSKCYRKINGEFIYIPEKGERYGQTVKEDGTVESFKDKIRSLTPEELGLCVELKG